MLSTRAYISFLQVSMIESYLRANKMFVDYSEVCHAYILLLDIYIIDVWKDLF